MSWNSFSRILPQRKAAIRAIGKAHARLAQMLAEEKAAVGLTKAAIARRLGIDPSALSRRLNGRSNLTLESLAEIAWAAGREVEIELPQREHGNRQHATMFLDNAAAKVGPTSTTTLKTVTDKTHQSMPVLAMEA